MNIAIIFAGGSGQRMNTASRPKQFLEVHGKPVLIYTLENFQNHPEIDKIVLVCLESWMDYAKGILKKFGIDKAEIVVPGGATGQASIERGITAAACYGDDAIVLIHDGVRPLICANLISDCIRVVKEHGNAITVAPAIETIFLKQEETSEVGQIFNRSQCEMAKAPQCFRLGDVLRAHEKAREDGECDFIDSASLMQHYGAKLFTVQGSSENIKITTPADFYIFRVLLDARENSQILGL